MTITRNFIFEEDRDYGEKGLRPIWIQNANTSRSIAHDVLEHFSVEKGSPVAAELQAIGACLALRVQTGILSHPRGPAHVLASPITETLRDALDQDIEITAAPATRPLFDQEWAEALIPQAVAIAFDECAGYTEADCMNSVNWASLKKQRADVVSWLRIGYRRALARYQGKDLYTLGSCLFTAINKASQRLVDSDYLAEGTLVTVNVDPWYQNVNFTVEGRRVEI